MSSGIEVRDGLVRRGEFSLDVSLTATAGAPLALVGPNGSGKTTVLHTIAGLLPLAQGEVRLGGLVLDGPQVWQPPERRRIGLVPQQPTLLGHLSALENVAFGPRAQGVRRGAARTQAMQWLERLDLGHLATRSAARLSGGQAQAVAIARAFASRPAAMLLDEPFSALDADARPRIRALVLAQVVRMGVPTILVSHDEGDVAEVASRVVVL